MTKGKKAQKVKVLTLKKERDFFSLIDKRLRRQGYELLETTGSRWRRHDQDGSPLSNY